MPTNYPQTNWAPMNNQPTTWPSNPYQWSGGSGPSWNQQAQRKPYSNLLRAAGPESAKAFQMAPNDVVVLFDANNPTFYLVSSDDSGFKTMRTFDFQERIQEDVEPPAVDDGMREEIDTLKSDVREIKELLKGLVS